MAYGWPPYGMASRDIVTCLFLIVFLYSTFGQTVQKPEIQPQFLAPLENHTVTQGRDVSFTCVVNHLQSYKVAWIKSDSRAILAIHTHMVAHNSRLSVTHNGHNAWKLHVSNVQPNDSGTYMCQVNTEPMKSQTGHMKVVIPPDIMDLDNSVDLLTAKENNDLQLRCRATGTPKPVVTWRREDGRNITLRSENGIKQVKSYEGEQLHLSKILRQDMGPYLCIASNGVPPSVSKRYSVNVHFKPVIKVSNQLVAAPINSDVVLQCYVESSPKALNTWYKDVGMKLLSDEKHNIFEITIKDYAYQLNLTVRHLSKDDFGSYTCTAENAFGKAEGTIRLQELHLPRTTIATIRKVETGKERNWDKQQQHHQRQRQDRKGKKYSYALEHEEMDSTQNNGLGLTQHTTPIARRNSSNVAPNVIITKNSKVPTISFPAAPAPAPAHSAPTQHDVQNDARNVHHHFRFRRVLCFAMAVATTFVCDRSRTIAFF